MNIRKLATVRAFGIAVSAFASLGLLASSTMGTGAWFNSVKSGTVSGRGATVKIGGSFSPASWSDMVPGDTRDSTFTVNNSSTVPVDLHVTATMGDLTAVPLDLRNAVTFWLVDADAPLSDAGPYNLLIGDYSPWTGANFANNSGTSILSFDVKNVAPTVKAKHYKVIVRLDAQNTDQNAFQGKTLSMNVAFTATPHVA